MQKQYTVQAPDGRTITLEGPDGASQDEVIRQAQSLMGQQPSPISPERMAGRQATSTAEFETNNESTMLSRARELMLGGAEGLGVDLQSPILGTAKNLVSGLSNLPSMATPRGVVDLVKGLAAGPQEAVQGAMSGDYDQMAHGVGGTIATDLPLAAGGAAAIDSTLSKAKALRTAQFGSPAVQTIEKGIAPSGVEAKATTLKIGPELSQDPQLMAAKGIRFDQRLLEKFKGAEAGVEAAEQSVPRTTTLPQKPITDGLEAIIEKYRDMGADDAAAAVAKEWDKWASLPTTIPWEDFLKRKRTFGQALRTMGRFRETGTAAEKATAAALRESYGQLMSASGQVSKELAEANHAYSIAHQAVDSAGLDMISGRRYTSVAGVPQGRLKSAAKTAGKAAAIGAAGATGYGIMRNLGGQ